MPILLLLLVAVPPHLDPVSATTPASIPSSDSRAQIREQAHASAIIGLKYLHIGRLADAQSNCDQALKLDPDDPKFRLAKECLDQVAERIIDQDLNDAAAKLTGGDKQGAIALAAKWEYSAPLPAQQKRASQIVERAKYPILSDLWKVLTPEWIRQVFAVIVDLSGLALLLLLARWLWRKVQGPTWQWNVKSDAPRIVRKIHEEINHTNWSMLPLKELPPPVNGQTGVPTDAVLDALSRLGHELKRELWQPKLLLLRPTPPANYEPALISEFCSKDLHLIVLAPGAADLSVEWNLHDVQLSQAVQNLQLKTATGIDIGSVARFISSIVEWFNAGTPTICGVAETADDQRFTLHLTARGSTTTRGGAIGCITVSASTAAAPGIDPIQITAEGAAFKFLLRLRHPEMTDDEIDGFSALRQGAFQFVQFAGTIPSTGNDATARVSSLKEAAMNFSLFRASIPLHSSAPAANGNSPGVLITDDIRQAALLAEGVAHALIGEDPHPMHAIDCFRQLQDWPGSPETITLRQQAAYNEAVMWGQVHSNGRCVLMLTDLLGERAPDTIVPGKDDTAAIYLPKSFLPSAIRFPARVARLSAFSRYTRDEWSTMPRARVKLLMDDGEKLIADLKALRKDPEITPHDQRMAAYLYAESLRGIGHVQLLSVITGDARTLYQDNRPTGLKYGALTEIAAAAVQKAITWMVACEQRAPGYELYCDLAEAHLLLKEFSAAEGYARHATLQTNLNYERASYLATESFYLQHTEQSKALAIKYAQDYLAKSPITLDEFKSVCSDLGITATQSTSPTPQPPP